MPVYRRCRGVYRRLWLKWSYRVRSILTVFVLWVRDRYLTRISMGDICTLRGCPWAISALSISIGNVCLQAIQRFVHKIMLKRSYRVWSILTVFVLLGRGDTVYGRCLPSPCQGAMSIICVRIQVQRDLARSDESETRRHAGLSRGWPRSLFVERINPNEWMNQGWGFIPG